MLLYDMDPATIADGLAISPQRLETRRAGMTGPRSWVHLL
jgi:hypothetical protein